MDENISNIDNIILSFLKGEISDAEKKILEDWINSAHSNKDYFKDIYRAWEAASSVSDEEVEKTLIKLRNRLSSENEPELLPKGAKISLRVFKWAAIVVFAFISGALTIKYFDRNKSIILPYKNEITVPLGSISTVRL
ncbi:MAG TPA: hypothetical protein VHO90_04800, partial [Bacteroidales bacterium]|nr:hypothetical protein [Bacteroidales bacterium]